ncbi:GDYXXLXY domain-containing protein [Marinicella sp. S1101]|uniref:GDYXXLXY domain-containing protein n=1 Tax=Marinicella marina TaxID=2996016 RepID=UPI002260C93F|nr:GDYXXLXY domain-containing protein [Marinicella marina]MCX7554933.1 GDYXXLXY domain-containing protein [Marinicella marina]MDJ1141543.1 GDYXXLXY domain-containing protein [Marinicella marina]
MNQHSLWRQLKQQNLVSGNEPEFNATEESLWYVRAMQGFAGWLAALFLIGFLGVGVAGLFEHGVALIIMGLIINYASYVFFKTKPESDFFEQLVLVFSLTGQFLFVFGLFELYEFRNRQLLLVVAIYQAVLVFLINQWLHRFLSTWFAIMALFWGVELLVFTGIGSAALAILFVWLWLDKTGWQTERVFYEPIAYASAFALLQYNLPHGLGLASLFWYRQAEPTWLMLNGHYIAAVLNSAVLLYFIYRVMREQQLKFSSTTGKLIVLAAVLSLFTALPVIGLSSALLVLLVGFARRNPFLLVLGVLAMLGFVSWFYYNLNTTLLNKSLILMVAGLVLLLGYLLLRLIYRSGSEHMAAVSSLTAMGLSKWQRLAAVITLLLTLVGVNHAILKKEAVLKDGQSVFLALAPVDPRSLMQGDYMRLRFAMANQIRSQHQQATGNVEKHHDGYVWVILDDRNVGEFHSTTAGVDGAIKMQYRIRNNRVQFATNAFFFQEGDAQLFDQARFGEFKVAEDGELLLKAMYDEDLKLLGENRLD